MPATDTPHMRRVVLVLLLCVGLALTAATAGGTESRTQAAAAEITPLPAVPADSVVDSYGVGIHLAFLDTPYADASAVADALSDLGVRHVRDDLFMRNPRQYAGIRTVADKGIAFDLIMGRPTSAATAKDYVETVATQLPRGSVESIEGTNEWDLSGRSDWVQEMQSRQKELYEAAKAEPATADLPVLAPSLAFKWNYLPAGDMSQYADRANAHMYPGGYKPSNEISQITTAVRGSIPHKPLVTTEAGYHNALNTTNGHRPVPEDVAGVYTPRVLLEHFLRGEERVYTYELIDEFDDPGLTDPEAHFGLLRRDWSPKPAYAAMKNLLGLLADPGPDFTAAPLPLKATGFPSDGKYLLTQKRDGQYVLLLWRDVAVYDPVLQQRQSTTPASVSLQLAGDKVLSVHRPSQGSAPVSQSKGSSLTLPMDGEVTAVTMDAVPPAPAPQTVTTTSRNASAVGGLDDAGHRRGRHRLRGRAEARRPCALGAGDRPVGGRRRTHQRHPLHLHRACAVARRQLRRRPGPAGRPLHDAGQAADHRHVSRLAEGHRDLEGAGQRRQRDQRLPARLGSQVDDGQAVGAQGHPDEAARQQEAARRAAGHERPGEGCAGVLGVRADEALTASTGSTTPVLRGLGKPSGARCRGCSAKVGSADRDVRRLPTRVR